MPSVLAVAGVAMAASVLFTQTFPAAGPAGTPPGMTSNCGGLTSGPVSAFVIGAHGFVAYQCGAQAAFAMTGVYTDTPQFTLPSGIGSAQLWADPGPINGTVKRGAHERTL